MLARAHDDPLCLVFYPDGRVEGVFTAGGEGASAKVHLSWPSSSPGNTPFRTCVPQSDGTKVENAVVQCISPVKPYC